MLPILPGSRNEMKGRTDEERFPPLERDHALGAIFQYTAASTFPIGRR